MHRMIKIVGGAGIAGVVLSGGILLVLMNGGQAGGGAVPARGTSRIDGSHVQHRIQAQLRAQSV